VKRPHVWQNMQFHAISQGKHPSRVYRRPTYEFNPVNLYTEQQNNV
jgi:hypothetical protein